MATLDTTTQPRAVFRSVEMSWGHLIVDVTVDPVEIIGEVRDRWTAEALTTLLGRHADEFCDLLAEARDREPF